jgi:hypothetical protein
MDLASHKLIPRIESNNGAGWYWELITQDHEVIARGLADTEAQALASAESAEQLRNRATSSG